MSAARYRRSRRGTSTSFQRFSRRSAQAPPSDLPGRSLLPAAERGPSAQPRTSYFEAMGAMLNRGWAPLSGVLVDRDKFIDLPIVERYDLAADPAERVNLSGKAPERDRALVATLRAYKAAPPGERREEVPEAAARLRALGYVSGSAPTKARYTDADDPKQLVDLDRAVHDAVEAFGARRFDEAVRIYQTIVARRPDMAIAYRHLAFVEWQRGNPAGALDALQRAVKGGITQTAVVAQLGGYLADTGRTGEAIALLEPLAANPGAEAETLNALGIAYIRAGRRGDAEKMFTRVLAINPDSSVPLENLGVMALERGDLAGARRRLRSRGGRRSAFIARARRAGCRRTAGRRSPARDRGLDASRPARPRELRRGVQPRHDAGARRAGGRRQAVPRAVPQDRAAGVLCQGSQGSERTVAPLSALTHEDSKNMKDVPRRNTG